MTRNWVLKFLTFAVFGLIVARLFVIQIIEHDEWVAKAAAEHTNEVTLSARRGEIYMMDGENPVPVVMNTTVYTVIVDPMVANEEKVGEVLKEEAGAYLQSDIAKIFENKASRYFVAAKNVPLMVAEKIEKEDLAGVWFKKGNQRVYPEGEMASQLLGFVNAEGEGQYGIEGALNKELAGKDGMLKSVVDVNNVALSIGDDNVVVAAEDGKDVVLTIDKNIQTRVEEIIASAAQEAGQNVRAAAVVMDPRDGRVLAMGNYPNYNPAEYSQVEDASVYVNYTTEVAYEPASVCKTFTFAAGIDKGVMNAGTTYYNSGAVTVDGFTIHNAYQGQYGTITLQTGLDYSLNTSSVYALTLMGGAPGVINQRGREVMYDYYHNHFGLGDYTGIEVAESAGYITEPNADVWAVDLTYANMTFGQGINLTMMQVASAISAMVNGGVWWTPTVVYEGEKLSENYSALKRNEREGTRVISEATSAEMREMLYKGRSLMRLYGIDRDGYYLGGKTGTAQALIDGKYADAATGDTIASYVGFGGASAEEPEFVVMVKMWGEGARMEGEKHARPLWNEIANYLIDYLQIEPKY